MRKEELRNLKRINATPKMVVMAKDNAAKLKYCTKWAQIEKSTRYDIFVRCQSRGRFFMVCVFIPSKVAAGELTPTYEIYLNKEGNEYITRILEKGKEVKWSKAMILNLGRIGDVIYNINWFPNMYKRIWQNPEGSKEIQDYFGTKEKGIWGIMEWQQAVRDKKIKEAEERVQAPWDADMKLVPDIPKAFKEWMMKEAAGEYFIFYDYSRKGAVSGYCSHCHRYVPVKQPRHNKEGRCRLCGVKVKYKVSSKIKTLGTHEYQGEIIQKIKGGVVIRQFRQMQWYRDADIKAPHSYLKEVSRILLLENGVVKGYWWGLYKNKINRWILDRNYIPYKRTYYSQRTIKLYKRNLSALKKSVLKHSAIDLWDPLPTDAANYLAVEHGNPLIEKLARIGMFGLAKDFMKRKYESGLINPDATELAKMMKIDNGRLRRLKAMDGKIDHLKWLQYEKMIDTIWPDGMIRDFGDAEFKSSDFGFLPLPLKYVKIWNYLKKQSALTGYKMARLLITWEDYMNMAHKAKADTKSEMIYKPKNLQAAHDKMVRILQKGAMEEQAKKLEKEWPKVNEVLPKLKKFEYSDGKYTILAPSGIIDIVEEGTILQHCVHTCDFYFDRIQKNETYLFFLRKADFVETPWYTLEVEPSGNIRQKRTTGDNQNKDFEEAVKFLKKWQKEFRKRMTAEEKVLGIKSNQARLDEYAKLRKDGNKVWHGRLAGKLLADVLEADFMEVD